MDLEDHDNDDIERELYQLGLTDVPPRPPPALRGAPLPPWPPPHPASARSRSAPSIQEDSLEEPPVLHNPRPPPPHHHHPPGPPPLTHHNPFPTRPGVVGGGRLGLWGGAPHPPVSAVHHSLTDLASDNPGHNYAPARTTAAQAAFNGALAGAAQGTTTGEESVTSAGAEVTFTTAAAAAAVSMWQQDPSAVHYPGYVRPQDFNTLPRGPRDVSPRQEPGDEDEERLAALVTSVEAALRRIHAGLQESYIMYENPDDEEDPPPPQPVTASLRDPPPSPVPPHEPPGSPPPPAGPQGPMPPTPQGGVGGGAPRLVGPDNASMLSRQLGFIPIQEGAPQPPQGSQPAPRHAERHHHHHHKLSKKVKNHKSKSKPLPLSLHATPSSRFTPSVARPQVLLSGLMTCPGPGFKLLNITRDSKSGQGFGFSIKGGREAAPSQRSLTHTHVTHSPRSPLPSCRPLPAIHLQSCPRASHLMPLMSRGPLTAAPAVLVTAVPLPPPLACIAAAPLDF
ncbi:uncharacterized protein LOC134771925 [Penaeus indicus]|uniref:uncharacterized protein LOC134771925 n=1 Tax=Penaeus indicus TaxID=29960 RepID=UPI00300C67D7